jgi:hypothetical protein
MRTKSGQKRNETKKKQEKDKKIKKMSFFSLLFFLSK